MKSIFLACIASVSVLASAQHGGSSEPSTPLDWRSEESGVLSDHVQLTHDGEYLKAGEAYFNHDASWIIFQAVKNPGPRGGAAYIDYSMFAAPLLRDSKGRITGLGETIDLMHNGSANTCGWWHPTEPGLIMFGSTLETPKEKNQPGYQRGTGKYKWSFPVEMEIVTSRITQTDSGYTASEPEVLFRRDGYDAEGSWSPDGRHVLYANVDTKKSEALGRPDADIWAYDMKTGLHTILIEAAGYDGGPFFSPDGKWITFRSDRRGDDLLQLFIAELEYDESGRIIGISREVQLTDNQHVNWAPYWHPSGRYLIYTTSEVSHRNYEVFAIPALDDAGEPVTNTVPIRVTSATGFDGLSVFSPDGSLMMWTSQRGGAGKSDAKAMSQVWIGRLDPKAIERFIAGE